MTRQFGKTTIEDLYMALDAANKRIDNLENRKDQILPFRDSTAFPPGQEGQVVLAPPGADTDTTQTFWYYADGSWQQLSGVQLAWIYVGTDGVDGIDSLLAANPAPYATADTPGNIAFDNGTTVPSDPLAFAKFKTALFFSGGHTGQVAGDSIFTLPVGFRPAANKAIQYMFSDFSALAAADVQTDGQVIYKGSSAIVFT